MALLLLAALAMPFPWLAKDLVDVQRTPLTQSVAVRATDAFLGLRRVIEHEPKLARRLSKVGSETITPRRIERAFSSSPAALQVISAGGFTPRQLLVVMMASIALQDQLKHAPKDREYDLPDLDYQFARDFPGELAKLHESCEQMLLPAVELLVQDRLDARDQDRAHPEAPPVRPPPPPPR